MINVIEQFKDRPDVVKAESKGKNTLILVKLKHRIKRFDGKVACYALEHRWHRMVIMPEEMSNVHRVQGDDCTYWLKKEINFEKGLFGQFNLF
jgi:hypothetical protein